MADITEQLLRITEEIELPKKGRTVVNGAREEIVRLRRENKEASQRSEAEICRLREGLRELRYGLFKDAEAVNTYIDSLLKAETVKEF